MRNVSADGRRGLDSAITVYRGDGLAPWSRTGCAPTKGVGNAVASTRPSPRPSPRRGEGEVRCLWIPSLCNEVALSPLGIGALRCSRFVRGSNEHIPACLSPQALFLISL